MDVPERPEPREVLLDLLATVAQDEPVTIEMALDRVLRAATGLVGAQYAAIGVIDPDRAGHLALFVHTGIPDTVARTIGEAPVGRGLLGSLLLRGEPLRLPDLREHPDFTGFPPHHPSMRSFLGVPIRVAEHPLGYLYLTEKQGAAEFSAQDEEAVVALAATAGAKIAEAHRFELERTRAAWLDATLAISSALLVAEDPMEALGQVCALAQEVAGADVARLHVGHGPGSLRHTWVSWDEGSRHTQDTGGDEAHPPTEEAVRLCRPVRGGSGDEDRVVVVPLTTPSGLSGSLCLTWRPEHRRRYDRLPIELPASLAEQAALAVEIAEGRRNGRRIAVLEERHRIARDLHDVILQQLFAAKLDVESCARRTDQPDLEVRLQRTSDELHDVIRELRRTVFGLGWSDAVTDPASAVRAVVGRAAAVLKLRPTLHLAGPLESIDQGVGTDLVAVLTELLSNVARHAGDDRVEVSVVVDDALTVTVEDHGVGVPDGVVTSGLSNLRDRATAHGGGLDLGLGRDGPGTRITWWVPLRSATPAAATPAVTTPAVTTPAAAPAIG